VDDAPLSSGEKRISGPKDQACARLTFCGNALTLKGQRLRPGSAAATDKVLAGSTPVEYEL